MSRGVAAILLAAGMSRRMGRCKQLLPLGETTVIGRCLDTLRRGGVSTVVVVVSAVGDDVARGAAASSARVVVNRQCNGDMASSIRSGRDSLGPEYSGVMVALCDYPLVDPATVETLIRRHHDLQGRIITPIHQDRRGHPLLFPRSVLDELGEGMTLRDIVRLDPARVYDMPVDDPGVLIDMDTPEDYTRICSMLKRA